MRWHFQFQFKSINKVFLRFEGEKKNSYKNNLIYIICKCKIRKWLSFYKIRTFVLHYLHIIISYHLWKFKIWYVICPVIALFINKPNIQKKNIIICFKNKRRNFWLKLKIFSNFKFWRFQLFMKTKIQRIRKFIIHSSATFANFRCNKL